MISPLKRQHRLVTCTTVAIACRNKGNKGTSEKKINKKNITSEKSLSTITHSKHVHSAWWTPSCSGHGGAETWWKGATAAAHRGGPSDAGRAAQVLSHLDTNSGTFCPMTVLSLESNQNESNDFSSCWDLLHSYSTVPPSSVFGTCEAKLKSKPKDLASQVKIHLNFGTPSPNLGPIETHYEKHNQQRKQY